MSYFVKAKDTDIINMKCDCGRHNECDRLIPVDYQTYKMIKEEYPFTHVRSRDCDNYEGEMVYHDDRLAVWRD